MTEQKTHEHLMSVRELEHTIKRKEAQVKALKSCLEPSGIRYDLDKVQTSPKDNMPDFVGKIIDTENEIINLYRLKAKLVIEIASEIEQLSDNIEKTVLMDYYIARTPIRYVAEHIRYSIRNTYRIRRNGVMHLSHII